MKAAGGLILTAMALWPADSALPTNRRIKLKLAGGQVQSYGASMQAGQTLTCLAMQRRVDVVLKLHAPDGAPLLEVDSPNGNLGPEYIHFVAEIPGLHRLEITVPGKTDPPGRVELRCDSLHAASPADRDAAAGTRATAAGDRALATRRADALVSAATAYQEAARLFPAHPFEQAVARHKLAEVQGRLGRRSEALATAADALAAYGRLHDRSSALAIEQVIGFQHGALGNHDEALNHYRRAAGLARAIHNPRSEGVMVADMAISHMALSQYRQAQAVLEHALPLHRKAGDRSNEAVCLSSLATVLRFLGRFDEAVARGEEGLQVARVIGSVPAQARALNNLGVISQIFGRYEQAIRYYSEALKLAEAQNDQRVSGNLRNNLGNAYRAIHQYSNAVRYHQDALDNARRINDRTLERLAVTGLGNALFAEGRLVEAGRVLDDALNIAIVVKDREGEAAVRAIRARVYSDQSQPTQAAAELDRALTIRGALGDRRGEAQILCEIARLRGPVRDSLAPLNRCLLTSRALGDRPTEAFALSQLMRSWNAIAQPGAAVFFGKQSVNRLQELRADVQGLGSQAQQSFTEANAATYRDLAAILIAQGRLAEARQVLDLLKEEEYFDFLRRDPATAPSVARRAFLTDAEAEADRRYTALAGSLAARSAERGRLLTRTNRAAEDEARLTALDKDLELANAAFQRFLDGLTEGFAAKPAVEARLEQLRDSQALMEDLRQLPAGTVAIYTLITASRLHTILVTPDLQRAYESPASALELNRAVLDFRLAIEKPRGDPKPAAQKLYHLLIAPELDRDLAQVSARTLMWSLDGVLRYIPVAALHDGRRYMVERFAISVFTPASNSRLKDTPNPSWRAAGFGVTRPIEGFQTLAGVETELRSVIREPGGVGILPGTIRLNESFTQGALGSLRQAYPVVHIASHFYFQPGSGAASFLLMGDGSHLSLDQMRRSTNLFGKVDLLTLSACNTGSGDSAQADGKEVESFGVLAQRQGAKAVLATLWPVADESTSRLMRAFYRHRQEDRVSKAEALRRSQMEMLAGVDPAAASPGNTRGVLTRSHFYASAAVWAHPYFWAPFFLIGNWL